MFSWCFSRVGGIELAGAFALVHDGVGTTVGLEEISLRILSPQPFSDLTQLLQLTDLVSMRPDYGECTVRVTDTRTHYRKHTSPKGLSQLMFWEDLSLTFNINIGPHSHKSFQWLDQ